MSITVRTENGTDHHPRAADWSVSERGGLRIFAANTLVAEYPPGAWFTVTLDDEAQDGVNRADGEAAADGQVQHFVLAPGEHRLRIMGKAFELTGFDYCADGTAKLHARVDW